ncbi:MAG: hypothetical protein ABSH11_11795 [Verrucomicrobiota bacterium]
MTALEAIPKVSALIADLIKRAKDRETQALVQQIQEHQLVIQQGLMDANAKIAKMEDEHPKAIAALKEEHRKAIAEREKQITQLKTPCPPRSGKIIGEVDLSTD